jgi:hypothetical protein
MLCHVVPRSTKKYKCTAAVTVSSGCTGAMSGLGEVDLTGDSSSSSDDEEPLSQRRVRVQVEEHSGSDEDDEEHLVAQPGTVSLPGAASPVLPPRPPPPLPPVGGLFSATG